MQEQMYFIYSYDINIFLRYTGNLFKFLYDRKT